MINYKRNSNPKYYEEHCDEANCGSYALNLQGWYDPEGYFCDMYGCEYPNDVMEILYENGYDEDEMNQIYVDTLVEGILKEFKDELRLLRWNDKPKNNEELIAFRTYVFFDEEYCDDFAYDFHFKVFRNGKWMEKQGWHEVKECTKDEWGYYNSKTYYFAHKIIGEENV